MSDRLTLSRAIKHAGIARFASAALVTAKALIENRSPSVEHMVCLPHNSKTSMDWLILARDVRKAAPAWRIGCRRLGSAEAPRHGLAHSTAESLIGRVILDRPLDTEIGSVMSDGAVEQRVGDHLVLTRTYLGLARPLPCRSRRSGNARRRAIGSAASEVSSGLFGVVAAAHGSDSCRPDRCEQESSCGLAAD
jgi:hypothetical protein